MRSAAITALMLFFGAGIMLAADLRLEYRKNSLGSYSAVFSNRHNAAVTAYIAQASFTQGGRERHASIGGDTLGFTNGEEVAFPAGQDTDTGRALPGNESASATRVLAAIFADGATEGDDEVVAMLLSGRHRALLDLNASIPELEKTRSSSELLLFFQAMAAKDEAEGASLDQLQDAPGRMRYRFFMSAVPARALQILEAAGTAETLRAEFRDWQKRLLASKPDVR